MVCDCFLWNVLVGVASLAEYLTPRSTARALSASGEPARGTLLPSETFTGSNPSLQHPDPKTNESAFVFFRRVSKKVVLPWDPAPFE